VYGTMHAQSLPESSRTSDLVSPHFLEWADLNEVILSKDFSGVNSNLGNVWKSLDKMFHEPKVSYDVKRFERAVRLTKGVLRPHFMDGLNYQPEITHESVPGAWWKYYGYRTKREVLRDPMFWESWSKCHNGEIPYPPFTTSGKREFLKNVDITIDNKIRTFLIASLELLMDEKVLYGTQDEAMKRNQPGFIRYGINFHDGGFDTFVKDTLRDFYLEWDVSKWDRQLPILRTVMQIRNELLREGLGDEIWESIRPTAERVTDAVCDHPVLLPNGDVVSWPWSQMSGDGMTTSNNCIAHQIIFTYLLITACPEATDEEILSELCNLYGDDVFAGISERFGKMREYNFCAGVYSEFGLEIKKGTFKCQDTPEGMSFLGATIRSFKVDEHVYFAPSYSRSRLLTALGCSLDPLTEEEELMKLYSILELGWWDAYDLIAGYTAYFLNHKCPDGPVRRSFLSVGIPSREEIRNRWAGVYGSD
jgi:hypothetical protein